MFARPSCLAQCHRNLLLSLTSRLSLLVLVLAQLLVVCAVQAATLPGLRSLAEREGSIEAAEVISGSLDQRFTPFTDRHISPQDGARWFHLSLSSPRQQHYQILLLDTLYFQTVDAYFVPSRAVPSSVMPSGVVSADVLPEAVAPQDVVHYQVGLGYPYSARPIDYSRYAFPVPELDQQVELYLRVTVNTRMVFDPQLMSTLAFARHASVRNSWSTLFIGAIVMVAFYALVIGLLSGRARESVYFLGVMTGSLLVLLHFSGFLAQWLDHWPNLHRNLGRSFGTFTVAMHLLLFRHLFDFRLRFPLCARVILVAVNGLLALAVLTLLLGPAALASANRVVTQVCMMLILLMSLWQIWRRVPYSALYGMGILANSIGGLLFSLALEGGIDNVWLAQHGLELGLFFLALFYAVLLAMRLRDERLHRNHLREETEIAQAQSRAKSDFLAVMSHEIRTPMNGVLGMTELLRGTDLDEAQRYYTDAISMSGKTLLAVINDILDFSRVESGQLLLDTTNFSLDQVIDELVMPYRFGSFPAINMQTSIAPDVPLRLVGDPLRLRQVIVNLLSNAFKFTSGGDISLRVECIDYDETTAHLKFIVRDSGPGIPDVLLPRLFYPFQQAESSTSRKYGGSGLGLAICKRLVELMGGTISAFNVVTYGKVCGARFEFAVRFSRDASAAPVKPALGSLKGLTVLMVDDEPRYQQVFAEQARYMGVDLICVSGATAAMAVIRDGVKPGLIVLDKDMPDMDGLALARNLRTLPALADVPILMLAASSGLPTQKVLQQAGVQLASVKPVSVEQLQSLFLDVLAPLVGHRRSVAVDEDDVDLRGMQVLVAEDNPVNRQVIRGLLRRLQVSFDIVEGGLDAVERATDAACHYDIVLMDCEMPDIDGYAATRRIREFESASGRSRLPVVALTAHALAEFVERCTAAGMDGHLAKPVDVVKLRAMLANYFRPRGYE